MKILLIQPPVEDFYQTSLRTLPVGLLYLAASLRSAGIDVEVLDCQATMHKHVLEVPPEFAYLKRYYQPGNLSPFKLFSHYRHYGLPWEEIREHIRQAHADVIGISALFTPFYREALHVAALAKAVDPTRPVIMGGAHVNACPAQVLADPHVDFVVLGEGERTLPELVSALGDNRSAAISSICGVGYKTRGTLVVPEHGDLIEDIDALPLPARDLIDPARYTLGGKRVTMLITSRGCPYHCTFCSIFLTAGRQFRTRSISSIINEMRLCREYFGTEIFDIEDDNFSFDQKRATAILGAIREEFGDQGIELLAMNGISAANLSESLVQEMQRTGFRALNLALVTSDKQRQRATKRPGSTPHFDRVVQKGAEVGLEMVNYLILGLPDSSIEEMLSVHRASHGTTRAHRPERILRYAWHGELSSMPGARFTRVTGIGLTTLYLLSSRDPTCVSPRPRHSLPPVPCAQFRQSPSGCPAWWGKRVCLGRSGYCPEPASQPPAYRYAVSRASQTHCRGNWRLAAAGVSPHRPDPRSASGAP